MRTVAGLRTLAVAAFVAGSAGTLLANGGEFFPAAKGPVDLVYFGRVKDATTGRLVKEYPWITIKDKPSGYAMPFAGDEPGHYRSPDFGAAMKDMSLDLDTSEIEISIFVAGYKKVVINRVPRKMGNVSVDVKLERDPNSPPDRGYGGGEETQKSSSAAPTEHQGQSGGGPGPMQIGLLGGFALLAIVGVARSKARPASSTH